MKIVDKIIAASPDKKIKAPETWGAHFVPDTGPVGWDSWYPTLSAKFQEADSSASLRRKDGHPALPAEIMRAG
ncbi:MAG TPA: hypothetical protein VND90_13220 [Terracidiphilus sp.]|nr:hypothetical protein [Terracidiphilus sp.]